MMCFLWISDKVKVKLPAYRQPPSCCVPYVAFPLYMWEKFPVYFSLLTVTLILLGQNPFFVIHLLSLFSVAFILHIQSC